MYTDFNFPTKKALKEAVASGKKVTYHAPGLGLGYKSTGTLFFEGPHYPASHTWYAQCEVKDDVIVKVK